MNIKFYSLLALFGLISISCTGPKVVIEYQGSSPYPPTTSSETASKNTVTSMDSSEPGFVMISAFPEIPGGDRALRKKIEYPKEAIENKIEGTVTIQFFIEKNGETSGFKLIEGIGYGCDQAVITALKDTRYDMNGQSDARFLWLVTADFKL